MGLFSRFPLGIDPAAPAATLSPAAEAAARTQALRRLIGAALLLLIGLVVFALVFETQPRPEERNIVVRSVVAGVGAQTPAAADPVARVEQPPQAPPPVLPATPNDAADTAPAASTPSLTARVVAALTPETRASGSADASRTAPAPKPVAAPPQEPPRADDRAPPTDAAGDNDLKPAEAAADSGRYVVQVGAYSATSSAQEARMKVERLGFKTYTQVIESASGRRIRVRVGPFTSRAEATKVADKVKAAGMPVAVLSL